MMSSRNFEDNPQPLTLPFGTRLVQAITVFAGLSGLALLALVAMLALSGCGSGSSKITDPSDLRFIVAEADGGKFKMTQAMLSSALAKRLTMLKRNVTSLKPEERPYLTKVAIQDAVFQYELSKMIAAVSMPDLDIRVQEEVDKFRGQFTSDADIEKALAPTQLTMETYTKLVRQKLLQQAAVQQHMKPYVPTEDEIDEYYMAHSSELISPPTFRYSQILFRVHKPPAGTSKEKLEEFARQKTEVKKLAEAGRERLIKGEDFATLARELSDDVSTRDKGGDCGYVIEGTELPEVYQVVSTSKLNELSPVFESEYGYHVIKVTESVPQGIASRASARNAIVSVLKDLHKQNAAQIFVKQVLTDAKIVFYVPIADKPPAKAAARPAAESGSGPEKSPAPEPLPAAANTSPATAPAPAP